jgi:hypothetical protein
MSKRSWKERCAVYTVTVNGFPPTSPWAWPDQFEAGSIHVKNLTLTEARAVAGAFNKRAMQQRGANPAGWDRQWAIATCCTRNKGLDQKEDVPERPQLPVPASRGAYTSEEVERLLSVCDAARLPAIDGVSPGQWWRDFIAMIRNTGRRACDVLESTDEPRQRWPHGRRELYDTFHRLLRVARIGNRLGFHGLRLAYFAGQRQEGGAV